MMEYSTQKPQAKNPVSRSFLLFALILTFFGGTAFVTYIMNGPGLTAPQTISAYLNGAFPNVAPGSSTDYEYQVAFPNLTFDKPLFLEPMPGTSDLLLGQRDGKLYTFADNPSASTKTLFLDLSSQTAGQIWDGGMLGVAFHPEFNQAGSSNEGYFYLYYCYIVPGTSYPTGPVNSGYPGTFNNAYLRLSRFTLPNGSQTADPNSEQVMINIRLYNNTHRGGGMDFGPDGMLYLTIGEQNRKQTAQRITDNFEGGVIRIDVDQDPAKSHAPRRFMGIDAGLSDETTGNGYWIPNDNPWLDVGGGLFEEFFHIGNRSPHRMTYDSISGRFWIGEIGASTREEINVFDPLVDVGLNFEWPIKEGTYTYNPTVPQGPGTMTGPTLDFDRAEASAIIGGYVIRSPELSEFEGQYICGDYAKRTVFVLDYDENTGLSTKQILFDFLPDDISSFGTDHQQNIYICRNGNATNLYKVAASAGSPSSYPATLSATGAFSDLANLTPSAGLIPYDMTEPFWSDRAEKKRWMAIPNDGSHNMPDEQINFSENGDWDFPIGSVLIKHFDLPTDETNPSVVRRLETRFSIKALNGNFYFLTYKWRADGSDADLLTTAVDESYSITTASGSYSQLWHYPSQSECATCHDPVLGGTLGPRTRYLNMDYTYPSTGITANQLVTFKPFGDSE